jgi:hypothetical protein
MRSQKEALHSLEIELERDFGLSVVASRALIKGILFSIPTAAGYYPRHGVKCG